MKCKLDPFQPLCRWVAFCLFGVFLSGFAKHVSLLICMANVVVLLFT